MNRKLLVALTIIGTVLVMVGAVIYTNRKTLAAEFVKAYNRSKAKRKGNVNEDL